MELELNTLKLNTDELSEYLKIYKAYLDWLDYYPQTNNEPNVITSNRMIAETFVGLYELLDSIINGLPKEAVTYYSKLNNFTDIKEMSTKNQLKLLKYWDTSNAKSN